MLGRRPSQLQVIDRARYASKVREYDKRAQIVCSQDLAPAQHWAVNGGKFRVVASERGSQEC